MSDFTYTHTHLFAAVIIGLWLAPNIRCFGRLHACDVIITRCVFDLMGGLALGQDGIKEEKIDWYAAMYLPEKVA